MAFAPVLYADAAGYYADEGLETNVQAGKGAALAAQMTIAGQMDAGRTGGTNYMISRIENDAPLISIATIAQLSPFYVLSSAENPVNSIADLAGRTVGMATLGGSMEGTLNMMLAGEGIAAESVEKVKVADSAASFALIEAGRAGAFLGNTSSMVIASSARDDVVVMPIDDGMPGQVYVARPDQIAADPDRFIAFLRATHRAASEIVQAGDLTPILTRIGEKHDVSSLKNTETATRDLRANAENWAAKGQQNILRNVPEIWERATKLLVDGTHGTRALAEGLAMARVEMLEWAFKPFIVCLQLIPKIALAPLFILWFGFGIESKIVISAALSFFPVFSNSLVAFRSVEPGDRDVFTMLQANPLQRFLMLDLPTALPVVLAGMEVAVVMSMIGAIVGEFIGGNEGLGYLAVAMLQELQVPGLFAVIVFLTLIGLSLYTLISKLRGWLTPWHASVTGRAPDH
ncbi:ABC transporter substrate-binding protein [Paracoccus halophilus]|uniref:ABC transporter substrate-binding protein n=1 Tax=Paracoccus halophilus TaxID=376733 RepID=UPI0022B1EC2E|nr:ABC transporter substrate-binding protein [Paracoccus halophilus]